MSRIDQTKTLIRLLYTGAVYFFAVALVHALGIKIPGLFVYFNVPSHAYQDRIISFLAFGWSVFFFLAAKKMETDLVKAILGLGLIALIALFANTVISDFEHLDVSIDRKYFLAIISVLFIYWLSLLVFSKELFKRHTDEN
ncbi:MAG: hypothetical protein K9N35_06890 [Candidatus Marinimicrobia bacterium]|nr:hypothetical protein [Candidatus Neomarinimicrobiota bacterium]